jgi:hypothetical protein
MYDPACLNQSSLLELKRHVHLLNSEVQTRLKAIEGRIKSWPEKFDREGQHYREYAGIIAMSDLNQGHRLCHCFICNQPCGVWKLCPYCAWRRKMELHKKFLPRFHQHRWYAMTIAFTGYLVLCPAGDDIALYWKACVYAVKRMVEEGCFDGAVWSEELHIASFETQRVHPHLHIVILADTITMNEIERLKRYVREFQNRIWDLEEARFVVDEFARVALEVTTCTRFVRNRYHLANALAYLTKPINLWMYSDNYFSPPP